MLLRTNNHESEGRMKKLSQFSYFSGDTSGRISVQLISDRALYVYLEQERRLARELFHPRFMNHRYRQGDINIISLIILGDSSSRAQDCTVYPFNEARGYSSASVFAFTLSPSIIYRKASDLSPV